MDDLTADFERREINRRNARATSDRARWLRLDSMRLVLDTIRIVVARREDQMLRIELMVENGEYVGARVRAEETVK